MIPHSPQRDRAVRVFISSTFRDMHEERELLVKHVFPQLRKLCEERGVAFTDVDLRWGITEEKVQRGEVLPICLAEIERCRPYFVGLLGERYGWIPDQLDPAIVQEQPWLGERQGCSITELEILHGVLNNPEMTNRACFYFRDPNYVDRVPADQRAHHIEQTASTREKLEALKGRIRQSRASKREYRDPQELAELVLRDLSVAIDHEYPAGSHLDPLDLEAAAHAAFAWSRVGVYIGRQDHFDHLDQHARGDGPPLVLLGESGSGKSALLANWSSRHTRAHPADIVLTHFVGASSASGNWAAMLRRILSEFKRQLGMAQVVPDKPDDLRAAFPQWLHAAGAHAASADRRIVVLIDALNQLDDREGAPDLVWLPADVPANVRLVLSTLPGRPLNELARRGWPTLQLEPLTRAERNQFIAEYLAQYTKQLSPMRQERIAGSPCTSNPLYLRSLLEELRVFGIHERLDERIDYYLAADTIPALYRRILQRWEQDYERERRGLVRDALSLMWAARHGLSEAELVELLGGQGQPLPHAHWAPLYLAAESALIRRDGLLGFFHEYFRQAVRDSFLPELADQKEAHERLAEYFKLLKRQNKRRAQELPWQLMHAEQWETLFTVLGQQGGTDTSFNAIWEHNHYDLKTYWRQIEKHSPLRAIDAYRDVVEMSSGLVKFFGGQLFYRVAAILSDLGYQQEAAAMWNRVLEHGDRTGGELATTYANLGATYLQQGHYEEAERALAKAEQLSHDAGEDARVAPILLNQAEIHRLQGDIPGATRLLKEAEALSRAAGDKKGLRFCLAAQARILEEMGDEAGMLTARREEEELCRILGDNEALLECLEAEAHSAHKREQLDEAIALYRSLVDLAEPLEDWRRLVESAINLAQLLEYRGDTAAALSQYEKADRVAEAQQRIPDRALCLLRSGAIREQCGETETARQLYRVAEALARSAGLTEQLAETLCRQASQARSTNDIQTAVDRYTEAEVVCRSGNLDELLRECLDQHLRILVGLGDLEGALAISRENEAICVRCGDEDGLLAASAVSGDINFAKAHLDLALAAFRTVEHLARKLDRPASLFLALLRQVQILPGDAEDLRSVRQPLVLALRRQVQILIRDGKRGQCSRLLEDWKRRCIARNDAVQLAECLETIGDADLQNTDQA